MFRKHIPQREELLPAFLPILDLTRATRDLRIQLNEDVSAVAGGSTADVQGFTEAETVAEEGVGGEAVDGAAVAGAAGEGGGADYGWGEGPVVGV